jgi:hypothetical protein
MLVTEHNLSFYQQLMQAMRDAIGQGASSPSRRFPPRLRVGLNSHAGSLEPRSGIGDEPAAAAVEITRTDDMGEALGKAQLAVPLARCDAG